jgi:parallel beta-helix repeat protein
LVLLVLIAIFLVFDSNPQTTLAAPGDLFISPTGAGDCTQANPCSLADAMSQVEAGDVLYFTAGRYTGSSDAVITIEDSITMYGGWDGTTSDPVVRDPEAYPSILDGEDSRRVIFIEEGTEPVIDGFTITGGNATGLRSDMADDQDGGGGIYSYNASPIIKNNLVIENIASTEAGIRAFGGGIYLQSQTTTAELRSNEIISNTAGDGINQGDGGGLFVYSPALITQNIFRGNTACENCSNPNGGAIHAGWKDNVITITNNIIEQNQAEYGGGIYLLWSAVWVHQNIIRNNYASMHGGGISAKYDEGSLISANRIYSNTAKFRGGGVYVDIAAGSGEMHINNNILHDNQAAIDYARGIFADSDWHSSWITAAHNTLVGNGIGIMSGYHTTSTLVNNIIVSHTYAILTTSIGSVVYPDHNLFYANDDDGLVGTNPVYGNPSFVDADQGDYHILVDSSAKDAGINAGVTIDMDNHPRPIGPGFDIGADEYGLFVYLPFIAKELFEKKTP